MVKNDAILCNELGVVIDALREILAHETDHSRSKDGLSPTPDAAEEKPYGVRSTVGR